MGGTLTLTRSLECVQRCVQAPTGCSELVEWDAARLRFEILGFDSISGKEIWKFRKDQSESRYYSESKANYN